MPKNCPKCDRIMELFEDDPETGIVGGYSCECGHVAPYESDESDYMDDASRDESNYRSGS